VPKLVDSGVFDLPQQSKVCRDWPRGLGVRDQPASDVFGDLAGSRFWHFGRILAVTADPVSPSYRLPDEFDAVRRPTSRLQTDADVGWQSRHEFDPP
jgi:hypothetical protein